MEKYLVINGGSSSLKFSLYENNNGNYNEIISGVVERIGQEIGNIVLKGKDKKREEIIVKNHTEAVEIMKNKLLEYKYIESIDEIKGIGHRVLIGGKFYSDSVLIDDECLNNIKTLIPYGELHMPGEISVIESMKEILPEVPNIAAFDTSFHQTIPEYNYLYALPYKLREKYNIRKNGFHGTSHKYITEEAKKILGKEDVNIISCHIGNGSSITAIENGKSINTTMGFTPIDGVIMGTRTGSIDPSIIEFICKNENISVKDCMNILNKESGLLGISGVSSDIRDLLEARSNGNKRAALAIDMLEKSIIKYIAEYLIELEGNVDAIVFTAGIGENVPEIRKNIIDKLSKCSRLGIKLDNEANNDTRFGKSGEITTNDSLIKCMVIPTNEELMILKDTIRIVKENKNIKTYKLEK